MHLHQMVEAYRAGRLLVVWGDSPFGLAERRPANRALLLNRWTARPVEALPVPLQALPPLALLSLDPSQRVERAFQQAGLGLQVVLSRRDVPARQRHSLLKLAGDLPARGGVVLSRAEIGDLQTDSDKQYLLDQAQRAAEGGAAWLVGCDPAGEDFRAWWPVLASALSGTAWFGLGRPEGWPEGVAWLGADFTAVEVALREAQPLADERGEPAWPAGKKLALQDFADLEIRVLPRQGDRYPVNFKLNDQADWRGYLPADVLPWVSSGDDAADGEKLFGKLLSVSELRQGWGEARGQSPQRRTRIRLWLDVDEPALHTLPWELLCEEGLMLAADAKTPFSRYLPGGEWGAAVVERPLRALGVISNPGDLETGYNLASLDVAAERALLKEAFSDLGPGEVELDFLEPPVTLERLEARLQARPYHILHYIGHGAFSARRDRAGLHLQDEAGDTKVETDAALSGMLGRQFSRPLLVFLAACQSAKRLPRNTFSGLGPQLMRAGIPAVVAMQDNVSIKTANKFGSAFYPRLLAHGLVDRAMNEARSRLITAGRWDAAVPVLFMRLKSGRLYRRPGVF